MDELAGPHTTATVLRRRLLTVHRMKRGAIELMFLAVMYVGYSASAPRGFGSWTNELAAVPSLHAGWSLWVALILIRVGVPRIWRLVGVAYAATMAVVIVGTGNHGVLDVIFGWALGAMALTATTAWERRSPVTAHEHGRPAVERAA